jgi:hypothetical protein
MTRLRQLSGQALIESAVTIPILLILFLGFLAVGLAAQSFVDLNTAVNLAAASAVTAPADNATIANGYARDTFDATIKHVPDLQSQGITCGGTYPAPAVVTCTGSATIQFSKSPLALVVPVDPTITATATGFGSRFRSH